MDLDNARIMYDMTVKEVAAGLRQTQTVILPVGIVEQHGYHLPLSTDIHNAQQIAIRTSQVAGCFVAPTVHYNFSGGTLPGTINISPQVFSLLLMDIMQSLQMQGFRNIVILMGHGGAESAAAVRDAADYFQRLRPEVEGLTVHVVPFWELSETYMQSFEERDYHAGRYETSMMLYWKPELVKMDQAELDDPADMQIKSDNRRTASKFEIPRAIPDPGVKIGVWGDYHNSSAEFGKKICDECVDSLSGLISQLNDRS